MSSIDDLIDDIEETADHTVTTEGGDFEYTLPPAGVTVGRFLSYIELGVHPQGEYQGKKKPDAEVVRLMFELLSPAKNIKEIDVDGGKKKIADQIAFDVTIKLGEKAGFKKLFNAMLYGRQNIKHMARMLGEPFKLFVSHNASKKDAKKIYANLKDKDGVWGVSAPVTHDELAGTSSTIPVPEALTARKLFLWDKPTPETWASLFIDGTRTVKEEGKPDREVSKNWLQEKIMSAKNYPGSPLEAMLAGVSELSIDPQPEAAKEPAKSPAAEATEALEKQAEKTTAQAAKDAAGGLAELGL